MSKPCYFQGCSEPGVTKEHIPPKSFFPQGQRNQLLTVPSCTYHNNDKSNDDLYALAQVCINASPDNGAQAIFLKTVAPQLGYNEAAFRKLLASKSVPLADGSVEYSVDSERLDRFFSALSFGIVYKACGAPLPSNYEVAHIYHSLRYTNESPEQEMVRRLVESLYSGAPMSSLTMGTVATLNAAIYTVKLFGLPNFASSITVVHEFFGRFKVSSMLSLE